MSEAEAYESLRLAKQAIEQMEAMKTTIRATVNMTIELASFAKGQLDDAILQVAAGNTMAGLMILGDLRIRFDKFIEQNKGMLPK